MPFLDSIPLSWLKKPECAIFIQVLHNTMVVESSQDTSSCFEEICRITTQEYIRHFDPSFVPLPVFSQAVYKSDLAAALNNRAAILPVKLINETFFRNYNNPENQKVRAERTRMLQQAVCLDP
jgi:hypothetical protein